MVRSGIRNESVWLTDDLVLRCKPILDLVPRGESASLRAIVGGLRDCLPQLLLAASDRDCQIDDTAIRTLRACDAGCMRVPNPRGPLMLRCFGNSAGGGTHSRLLVR
jgi:hypothetical protein